MAQLTEIFTRTWERPPNEQELAHRDLKPAKISSTSSVRLTRARKVVALDLICAMRVRSGGLLWLWRARPTYKLCQLHKSHEEVE